MELRLPLKWKCVCFSVYEPIWAKTGGHCRWDKFYSILEGQRYINAKMLPGYKRKMIFFSWEEIEDLCLTEKDDRVVRCATSLQVYLQKKIDKGKLDY